MVARLLLAALAAGFLVFYVIILLGAPSLTLSATDVWFRLIVCLVGVVLLGLGFGFWPRTRRLHEHWTSYVVPASAFYLGWLVLALLAYHLNRLTAHLRAAHVPAPRMLTVAEHISGLGVVAGLVYLLGVRSFPPD